MVEVFKAESILRHEVLLCLLSLAPSADARDCAATSTKSKTSYFFRHIRRAPWRTNSWLLQLLRGSVKLPKLSRTRWSMPECAWPGREPSGTDRYMPRAAIPPKYTAAGTGTGLSLLQLR